MPFDAQRRDLLRYEPHQEHDHREQDQQNGSVLLILFAVVVFLVGLVSEQISSLRVERH